MNTHLILYATTDGVEVRHLDGFYDLEVRRYDEGVVDVYRDVQILGGEVLWIDAFEGWVLRPDGKHRAIYKRSPGPGPTKPVCPDCKGTKKYVGLNETKPCPTCQKPTETPTLPSIPAAQATTHPVPLQPTSAPWSSRPTRWWTKS